MGFCQRVCPACVSVCNKETKERALKKKEEEEEEEEGREGVVLVGASATTSKQASTVKTQKNNNSSRPNKVAISSQNQPKHQQQHGRITVPETTAHLHPLFFEFPPVPILTLTLLACRCKEVGVEGGGDACQRLRRPPLSNTSRQTMVPRHRCVNRLPHAHKPVQA